MLAASPRVLETLLAVSLFFLYYVLLGYVILNGLFIGVIVDNFTNIGSDNSDVTLRDIEVRERLKQASASLQIAQAQTRQA